MEIFQNSISVCISPGCSGIICTNRPANPDGSATSLTIFVISHGLTTVVSVPPHAVRAYVVSDDIALKQFYPTWRVFTDDPTFGDEYCGLQEENQKQRREKQHNLRLRRRST